MVDPLVFEMHQQWAQYCAGEPIDSWQFGTLFTESSRQIGAPDTDEIADLLAVFDAPQAVGDRIKTVVDANYARHRRETPARPDAASLESLAHEYLVEVTRATADHGLGLTDPDREHIGAIGESAEFEYGEGLFRRTFLQHEFGPSHDLPQSKIQGAVSDLVRAAVFTSAQPGAHALPGLLEAVWGIAPYPLIQAHLMAPVIDLPLSLNAPYQLWLSRSVSYILNDRVVYGPS